MPYVPHSTLTGANLHYNMGDSRSATAWTLASGTADALLIENSNGNDLLAIETSTTPGLSVMAFGNATDLPQHEFYGTSFSLVVPDDQTVFQITANGETPVRVETSSTTPHTLRLNNAWVRMAELGSAPTFVAGSGYLYTRDDAGTTRITFMRDDGTTVDLDNQGGGGTPGGSDTQVQYNNAGAFGGMANVEHASGNLVLVANDPSAPSAGDLVPHARSEAVPLLASRINGEAAMITGMPWASAHVFMWRPNLSSGISEIGISNAAIQGSASTPARTSGTMASRSLRNRVLSIASTNQAAGRVGPSGDTFIALETGFWIKFRINLSAMNSSGRAFVGLMNDASSIAGTVSPSTFLNCIGFAKDTADTNWQVFSNNGAGAAVAHADLGADFATSSTTAIIDFVLYAPAGSSTVTYWANRVDTAITPVTGTISTDLPSSSTFMTIRYWLSTGASISTAVSLDLLFMTGFKEV